MMVDDDHDDDEEDFDQTEGAWNTKIQPFFSFLFFSPFFFSFGWFLVIFLLLLIIPNQVYYHLSTVYCLSMHVRTSTYSYSNYHVSNSLYLPSPSSIRHLNNLRKVVIYSCIQFGPG